MAQVEGQGGTTGPAQLPGRRAALWLGLTLAAACWAWPVAAENGCSSGCRSAYGACYKSTHDRSRCQVQLQRCLEGCIRSRESGRRRSSLSGGAQAPAPLGRATDHRSHAQARLGQATEAATQRR
jgi:hypothetical protein